MSAINKRLLEVAEYIEKEHPEPCAWAFVIKQGESELRALQARVEVLEEGIKDAKNYLIKWRDEEYPLDMFPEPDMDEIVKVLGSKALSNLSASNLRHVVKSVLRELEAILKGEK